MNNFFGLISDPHLVHHFRFHYPFFWPPVWMEPGVGDFNNLIQMLLILMQSLRASRLGIDISHSKSASFTWIALHRQPWVIIKRTRKLIGNEIRRVRKHFASQVDPRLTFVRLLNFFSTFALKTSILVRLCDSMASLKNDPGTSGVVRIISKARILERTSCVPRKVSVLFSFLGSNDNPIRMNVANTLMPQNGCVGLRNEG